VEPGFVRIIHPELGPGSVSEVPGTSLPTWYMSGWRRLAEDEIPPEPDTAAPEPVTVAEVAAPAPEAAPEEEK
jgi:hypothetical protein